MSYTTVVVPVSGYGVTVIVTVAGLLFPMFDKISYWNDTNPLKLGFREKSAVNPPVPASLFKPIGGNGATKRTDPVIPAGIESLARTPGAGTLRTVPRAVVYESSRATSKEIGA